MTTGVHVDVILTCFFSCKDRASERYRPHQRKKKSGLLLILKSLQKSQPCNQQQSEDVVFFKGSLEGPDMMHIIHNATNNLGDVSTCYDPMPDGGYMYALIS